MLVIIDTEKLLKAKEFDWVHHKTVNNIIALVRQTVYDNYDVADNDIIKKDLSEIMALIDCIEVRDREIDQTLENLIKLTRKE